MNQITHFVRKDASSLILENGHQKNLLLKGKEMLRHLKMKLNLLLFILFSSIAFAEDNIIISKAFIKMPRPGVDVTAGFATISSDTDLKVMNVFNKNFKNIELHSMKMVNGVMEMRKLIEPKLGPNSPLVLSPGSDHLMLFGITKDLKYGQELDLTFVFNSNDGGEITKVFEFTIK
jgi:hypothetical protein